MKIVGQEPNRFNSIVKMPSEEQLENLVDISTGENTGDLYSRAAHVGVAALCLLGKRAEAHFKVPSCAELQGSATRQDPDNIHLGIYGSTFSDLSCISLLANTYRDGVEQEYSVISLPHNETDAEIFRKKRKTGLFSMEGTSRNFVASDPEKYERLLSCCQIDSLHHRNSQSE